MSSLRVQGGSERVSRRARAEGSRRRCRTIDFNERNKDRESPGSAGDLPEAQKKGPLSEKSIVSARRNLRMSRTQGIDATMNKYKLDAIVAPTGSPPWVPISSTRSFLRASSRRRRWPGIRTHCAAGYPRLPWAFLFRRAHSEATLIKLAYATSSHQTSRAPRSPTLAE